MRAVIISIGDEVLNGTTINTNASYIAAQIQPLGIEIFEILTISDQAEHILNALKRYCGNFEFIFITGGLGPTKDDITKKTMCTFFKSELIFHEDIYLRLKAAFEKRNIPFSENNRDQAYYPNNCEILPNTLGTAQGMLFTYEKSLVMNMPGVPFEMKGLLLDVIIPKIIKTYTFPLIINKHIMTSGMPESVLAQKLGDIENQLPKNITLAYLPSPGIVKLRLTAKGAKEESLQETINQFTNKIKEQLGETIYAEEPILLEEYIGTQLTILKATLATAESCTGGKIAHKLSSITGASQYLNGAIVAYTNEVKIKQLNVSAATIEKHGVVSEQTVNEMLHGAEKFFGVDFVIAVSGNAGPGNDPDEQPVGTIYIGVAGRGNYRVKKYFFNKNRDTNIEYASMFALHDLRILLAECLAKP